VTETDPMPAERLASIEEAISGGTASPDDLRELLAETKRARADSDTQYGEADRWRENYRIAKGLSDEEINAMIAVRDATAPHPRPCRFPHEACACDEDDEPETECERGDCLGIHRGPDGYQDCDGRTI
jgi:hypothetical protein